MDEIKRYNFDDVGCYYEEQENGQWCLHSDHIAIVAPIIAERDRLRELLEKTKKAMLRVMKDHILIIDKIDAALVEGGKE